MIIKWGRLSCNTKYNKIGGGGRGWLGLEVPLWRISHTIANLGFLTPLNLHDIDFYSVSRSSQIY